MVMSCGKVMCCALPSSSPASSLFFASFFTAPGFLLSPIFLFHLFPFFFVPTISLSASRCWLRAVRGILGEASIEGWIQCLFVGWRTVTIRPRLMVGFNGVLCIYVWRVGPTADDDRSAFRLSADRSLQVCTGPECGTRQPPRSSKTPRESQLIRAELPSYGHPRTARSSGNARDCDFIRAELPSNGYPQPTGSSESAPHFDSIRAELPSNGYSQPSGSLPDSALSITLRRILADWMSPLSGASAHYGFWSRQGCSPARHEPLLVPLPISAFSRSLLVSLLMRARRWMP